MITDVNSNKLYEEYMTEVHTLVEILTMRLESRRYLHGAVHNQGVGVKLRDDYASMVNEEEKYISTPVCYVVRILDATPMAPVVLLLLQTNYPEL